MELNAEESEAVSLYADVVFYRKLVIFFIILLVFTPAALLIAITGDVYKNQNGEAFKISKVGAICCCLSFMILGLSRLIA